MLPRFDTDIDDIALVIFKELTKLFTACYVLALLNIAKYNNLQWSESVTCYVKGQIINNLGFASYMVSVVTAQLCPCSAQTAKNNS